MDMGQCTQARGEDARTWQEVFRRFTQVTSTGKLTAIFNLYIGQLEIAKLQGYQNNDE